MLTSRFDAFVQLLAQLPSAVWTAAVTEEAEWKWMQPFSDAWEFGHFAAVFVVLGLNDYQTKGKADVGYWPKVVPFIPRGSDPREPHHLITLGAGDLALRIAALFRAISDSPKSEGPCRTS